MIYVKKPVVVEALQFKRENQKELKEFTNGKLKDITIPRTADGIMTGTVETLEGSFTATENDYIVKGIEGEFYPVKPNIFNKTYESIDN